MAIKNKTVTVNKKVITDSNYLVTKNDAIYVKNSLIKLSKFHYFKFNKPIGTLSTFKDPKNRLDLSWHLQKHKMPSSLKPCGRLDSDSSGLLLFSNDGHFINKILHPKFSIPKRYFIQLNKPLSKNDKDSLSSGFFLSDGPISIIFDETNSKTEFKVTISIGRNRILRRSFEHFGYTITTLHRLSIGPISIEYLNPGEFQPIESEIIKKLVQE